MGRLAVAVLVALSALLVATGAPVAPWLDRISGAEARVIVDVTLPASADAAAIEATWRARLREALLDVSPGGASDERVVTVACSGARQDCYTKEDALSRSGTFEVREVRAETPAMRAVFAALRERPVPGVTAEVDGWYDERTGMEHNDYFAMGPDPRAVADAIAAARATGSVPPLAPDEEIVFESFASEGPDGPRWMTRSYVVGGAPVITGEDVAEAAAIVDAQVERPMALLTMTDAGARRFGEATSRLVGSKLAILVDGHVMSAPVVQSAITQGQVTIAVGGDTPEEQMAQVNGIVAMLGGGGPSLPPGIRAIVREIVPASAAKRWVARGLLAALGGALAWVLATLIARSTIAAPRVVRTRGTPRDLVVPIAVTVAGVGVIEYLAGVFLPGLTIHIRDIAMLGGDDGVRPLSPVALGMVPVASAYMLVELFAWAVPPLRRRRVGTSAERAPLELAVAITAFLLALMQAYFILQYLRSVDASGRFAALEPGALVQVGIVASLVGGVAVHAVVAQLITRHGLCNGWLVLAGYAVVRNLPHDAVIGGLVLLGAVLAVALTARRATRPDARRLPVAGLVPAALIPTIIGLLALPYVMSAWSSTPVLMRLLDKDALQIGLACGIAVLLSLRRGTPAPVAMLTAIGISALIAGFPLVFPQLGVGDPLLAGAIAGVLCAELADGVRARLAGDAPLVVIHDVERADEYVDVLQKHGIAAFPTGARARGLYRGLGAFVPVTIHVPRDRAEEAATLLRLPPSRPSAPLPPPSAATGG